jgi:PQQ-dependent catabolism-associated CXXCW motif protein
MSALRSGPYLSAAAVFAALFFSIALVPPLARAEDMGLKAATVAEPETYRLEEYRKPVPATLKGATVLTGEQASALWSSGKAVFIDVYPHAPKPDNLPASTVWREPVHFTIENAKWLANVGYGVLSADTESYFKSHLEKLSGGDKAKPLVFFCLRNCWMSWNSAKRALTYGYTNVNWFSEGTDAWQEIGQPMMEAKPEP